MNVKHRIILELKGKKEAKVIWVDILNFSLQFLEVKFFGPNVFGGGQIIPSPESAVVAVGGLLLTWLVSWQMFFTAGLFIFKACIKLVPQVWSQKNYFFFADKQRTIFIRISNRFFGGFLEYKYYNLITR